MRNHVQHPVVFAYNFPHKKTQDFLTRLMLIGHAPSLVLLADPVACNTMNGGPRVKARHCDLMHPQAICDRFKLRFEVADHRSERCVQLLRQQQPVLGIVAGARILPRQVIESFSLGILNFHPGLLPEVRGLNALQWAILEDLPLGVTAHLIDHRVDAGRIVERHEIEEFPDDTFVDLSLRLYETQVQMLASTLKRLAECDLASLKMVQGGHSRRTLSPTVAAALPVKLARRQRRLRQAG